ncbi:MAG: sigma-70 family RNA polymerase sigma factor [Anaerolineae bacterium]|nr:sigma-70 family RNA polymerase sigma factor [Anaerolineae bacterium]
MTFEPIHPTTADNLLARAQALEPAALSQIHTEYYPAIYRYVAYRLNDEQLVEDVAGEVFLRLLDALHNRLRPVRDIRAWLFGTASHLVNDSLRNKYRKPLETLDDHESIPVGETPEHIAEFNERSAAVRVAITALTEDQQQVLTLRFAMDYSIEETAKIMGKSIGAVKTLQFRALGSLRRYLEQGAKE